MKKITIFVKKEIPWQYVASFDTNHIILRNVQFSKQKIREQNIMNESEKIAQNIIIFQHETSNSF